MTTQFKIHVNTYAIAHTLALRTLYYKSIILCCPQHTRMASLNSSIFSNMITLLANVVFTRVLNFRGHKPLSTHAFSHSYLPFLDFFVHVIVFLKTTLDNFHNDMKFQTYNHLFIINNRLAKL
jgi:hypothetical protein